MNSVNLIGNLTKDPEVRHTDTTVVAKFNLAVARRFKKDETDFINCTAFGKTAEFIEKYFSKGMKAALGGSIQTGSYTNKDGQKVYTTEVLADNIEFVEKKSDGATDRKSTINDAADQGFMTIDTVSDEGLPFN